MVGQKRQGLQAHFAKCAKVADMLAAGLPLAPVAMMTAAGAHSGGAVERARVEGHCGQLAAWLDNMS